MVLVSTLVVLVAGGGTSAWLLTRPSGAPEAMRQVITVSPTTLKTTVNASGTLEPRRQADLTFSTSGAVTAVDVSVGDEVAEGEALATSDTSELDIAVASAEADLVAVQESLSDLEDSDEASDSAINAARASVQVKKNAVAQARANLAAATLTAPFAGVVAEVNVAVGDATSSGTAGSGGSSASGGAEPASTSTSSSAAIVLISQNTYSVSTSVSSSDIASVKQGLQAELTVSGSDETIYGTVSSVAVVATASSSGTSSFPVTIDVTGTPEGLFAGSSVTAEIVVSQQADVIAVSPSAITTEDGASTVTKVVDGVDTPTRISTGETVGGSVIVTEGLAEGDQIVIETVVPTSAQGQGSGQSENGMGSGQGPGSGEMPGGGQVQGGGGQPPGAGQGGGQLPGGQGGGNG